MTGIPAIRVDDKNVVDYSTNRLDSDLAILTSIVQPLQCGAQEDARGIFEAEAAFVKVASAFDFVLLKAHRGDVRFKRSTVKLRPLTEVAVRPRSNWVRFAVCGRGSNPPDQCLGG
jgi:hypothetical protein